MRSKSTGAQQQQQQQQPSQQRGQQQQQTTRVHGSQFNGPPLSSLPASQLLNAAILPQVRPSESPLNKKIVNNFPHSKVLKQSPNHHSHFQNPQAAQKQQPPNKQQKQQQQQVQQSSQIPHPPLSQSDYSIARNEKIHAMHQQLLVYKSQLENPEASEFLNHSSNQNNNNNSLSTNKPMNPTTNGNQFNMITISYPQEGQVGVISIKQKSKQQQQQLARSVGTTTEQNARQPSKSKGGAAAQAAAAISHLFQQQQLQQIQTTTAVQQYQQRQPCLPSQSKLDSDTIQLQPAPPSPISSAFVQLINGATSSNSNNNNNNNHNNIEAIAMATVTAAAMISMKTSKQLKQRAQSGSSSSNQLPESQQSLNPWENQQQQQQKSFTQQQQQLQQELQQLPPNQFSTGTTTNISAPSAETATGQSQAAKINQSISPNRISTTSDSRYKHSNIKNSRSNSNNNNNNNNNNLSQTPVKQLQTSTVSGVAASQSTTTSTTNVNEDTDAQALPRNESELYPLSKSREPSQRTTRATSTTASKPPTKTSSSGIPSRETTPQYYAYTTNSNSLSSSASSAIPFTLINDQITTFKRLQHPQDEIDKSKESNMNRQSSQLAEKEKGKEWDRDRPIIRKFRQPSHSSNSNRKPSTNSNSNNNNTSNHNSNNNTAINRSSSSKQLQNGMMMQSSQLTSLEPKHSTQPDIGFAKLFESIELSFDRNFTCNNNNSTTIQQQQQQQHSSSIFNHEDHPQNGSSSITHPPGITQNNQNRLVKSQRRGGNAADTLQNHHTNVVSEASKFKLLEELFLRRASPIKYVKQSTIANRNKLKPISSVPPLDPLKSEVQQVQLVGQQKNVQDENGVKRSVKKCNMLVRGSASIEYQPTKDFACDPSKDLQLLVIPSHGQASALKIYRSRFLRNPQQENISTKHYPLTREFVAGTSSTILEGADTECLSPSDVASQLPPPAAVAAAGSLLKNRRSNSTIISKSRSNLNSNNHNNNKQMSWLSGPNRKQRKEKMELILAKCTDKTYFDPASDKRIQDEELHLIESRKAQQQILHIQQLTSQQTIPSSSSASTSAVVSPSNANHNNNNNNYTQALQSTILSRNRTMSLNPITTSHHKNISNSNNLNISSSIMTNEDRNASDRKINIDKYLLASSKLQPTLQQQKQQQQNRSQVYNNNNMIKGEQQEDEDDETNGKEDQEAEDKYDDADDDDDEEEDEEDSCDDDDEDEGEDLEEFYEDDEEELQAIPSTQKLQSKQILPIQNPQEKSVGIQLTAPNELQVSKLTAATTTVEIQKIAQPQTLNRLPPNTYAQLLLLKSVYANRPSTIFFQYPPQCGGLIRDSSRTISASSYEENRFDLRYKVTTNSLNLSVSHAFQHAGVRETEEDDWNLCWGTGRENFVRNMVRFQKTNHFPQYQNMGRKDRLWKNLSRVKRKFPLEYDFIPNTYILQQQVDWERFLAKRDESERGKLWIMKPSNQAQGKNIKMISKKSRVQRKDEYIICEYVANPHLINGLKYDLRVYVLVTSYDPLRVYIFDDGLTRFATEKYSTNARELSKRYVHLTNYSLNKHNPKFKQNQNAAEDSTGSKWSLKALFRKYADLGIDVDTLWAKIKDIIIKTCIAAEPYILDTYVKCENHRTNCFELYGFDILVDDTLKPWLLEVNVRPSLTSSSPLDRKIKHTLICDTFNLIGLYPFDKRKYEDDMKKRIPGAAKRNAGQTSKFLRDLTDLDEFNCIDKLSPDDWNMLFETDEENYRTGHFARIFPPPKEKFDYYMQFFEFERYNNLILKCWINASNNFLEKLLPKSDHLNV